MKSIELLQKGGEMHLMIEYMKVKAIVDGDIMVSMAKESTTALFSIDQLTEGSPAIDNIRSGQRILFRSTKSVPFIDEYVKGIIKDCSHSESNLLTIYNIDIEKLEKQRKVNWKAIECVSNKTSANNIVSADIQKHFYDDVNHFVESEASYNRRGIAYRRGYMITGIPGSGKSTLWESIANEHRWPVFRMDMSVLGDNSEVIGLLNSINDYIATGQKHILLLEDLDRSVIFRRWRDGTQITDDAVLNMIESRGAHGRIILITGNDRERMRNTDVGDAMFRSGRVDRDIKLNYCTIPQIEGILRLYFEYEDPMELDPEIETTVADLNKIVQLKQSVESIVAFLNKYKKLNGGDYIEELIKTDAESNEGKDDVPVNIDEVKKKAKNKALRRQKKNTDLDVPKKPRGMGVLEKTLRDIDAREKKQLSRKDTDDIEYQIEELQIKKLKIQTKKRQDELAESMIKYEKDLEEYNKKKLETESDKKEDESDETPKAPETPETHKTPECENPENPEKRKNKEDEESEEHEEKVEPDKNDEDDEGSIDGSSASNEVHSEEDNVAGWSDIE